jgi:CTP synthase (UTP-ammonia lyase)
VRELQLALIGDFDPAVTAHQAIPRALALAARDAGLSVSPHWIHTTKLPGSELLGTADGIWCVPASPYANPSGALAAIRHAREARIPFLGTCGGFQHAVLEAAASLWQLDSPSHAELDPDAPDPVVAPLACSLVEVSGEVRLAPGSRIASAYGRTDAEEQYHCRYGLNPRYVPRLANGPLRATAWDRAGDVRAVELDQHPFFVATLFQPERAALAGTTPPLVLAFLGAIRSRVAALEPVTP